MLQAATQSNTITRLPTAAKERVHNPDCRLEEGGNVEVHPVLKEAEPSLEPVGLISTEQALLTAMLMAYRNGNKQDRRFFVAIGWQLGRMLDRRPRSHGLNGAMEIWKSINAEAL
jgi:hypothetical protein